MQSAPKQYEGLNISIWQSDAAMIKTDEMADCLNAPEQSDLPRNVALDLGAHVGTRSLWLATDGGFKKVYAVEMQLDNYALLCKNIEKNDLTEKIFPILAAVSSGMERRVIQYGKSNKGQFSIAYDTCQQQRCLGEVFTLPLDVLIESIGDIDFVKMDLEGEEYRIFSSAVSREAIRRHVRFLFLERHGPNPVFFSDKYFTQNGYDADDPQKKLFKYLEQSGFACIRENDIGQLMMANMEVTQNALV